MKFIGQFIQHFISRFKNDVYLEDVSTGTIASGGNLGLDSNNKIVKATIASGSGDITGVSITTDSGGGSKAEDTGGSADFSILGSSGVGVTNSGTTITVQAVAGEIGHDDLSGYVAAEHVNWASASAGTIHPSNYTDTNTNQLTEFTLTGDSGSNQTIAHGNTLDIAGGTGINTVVGATDTVTVTAVPGEIDHDSLQNFDANEHFTQANITTVGTIGTGVWQGTAIATDQQKHLAHFCFKGYSTGDGTNYEMQDQLSDSNAPYEHNTSIGSDGLTATTQQIWMRTGGTVMPHGGTLKKWIGWAASAGSGTVDIGLFKVTPSRNTSSSISAVLLKNTQFTALGNAKLEDFDETSFSVSFAAGDMIVSAVKNGTSGKICYFSSTLEVEWS